MDEDFLNKKAADVQAALEAKHGTPVTQGMIDAISAQRLPPDVLRNVIASPTAVEDFEMLGHQSLLNVMQRGSPRDRDVKYAEEFIRRCVRDSATLGVQYTGGADGHFGRQRLDAAGQRSPSIAGTLSGRERATQSSRR
jgi:hypothetical protein